MADKGGLREFVAVVQEGSFTAAADALGVSTAFVSREVKRLEERLQARLLHRTTRSVGLTEMGRVYFERGLEIHAQLEALESEMADLQQRPQGLVKITAPGMYAERWVAPAVAEFTERYPEVSVELDTRMRVVDIVAEGYDIAIRMSALEDSSMIARYVAPRRIIVCASPGYLQRHGRPERPEDLRNHNCMMLTNMQWRFQHPDAVHTQRVRGTWNSDNGKTLVEAAIRGTGLVRITDYYVHEALVSGELTVVLEDYEVRDAATWIVFPARDHLPTRTRFLVDFLVERLKQSELLIPHIQ